MSEQDKNSNPPKSPPPAPKEKPQKSQQQDPYTIPAEVLHRSLDPNDAQTINK